jgi:hypothetical protein
MAHRDRKLCPCSNLTPNLTLHVDRSETFSSRPLPPEIPPDFLFFFKVPNPPSPSIPSLKQTLGWKTFKATHAATIRTPSKPINKPCLYIKGPDQPSLSSAILYTDRQNIHIVASDSATTKPLNFQLPRTAIVDACWLKAASPNFLYRRMVLMTKSAEQIMKISSVKTWKERPAIMMLSPGVIDVLSFHATEAMPPPAPCNNNDTMSQGMNWKQHR